MKTKIEALSNAFNIGLELGSSCSGTHHYRAVKKHLKKAVEEGLRKMSSQQPNAVDAKKPCGCHCFDNAVLCHEWNNGACEFCTPD